MRAAAVIVLILAAGAAGALIATRTGGGGREDSSSGNAERLRVRIEPLTSTLAGARVTASAIGPDGTVALGSANGELWLQDPESDAPKRQATRVGDGSPITRIAFSAGGTALAALTRDAWIWAWRLGAPVAATSRLRPSVLAEIDAFLDDPTSMPIAVSPDARYVATAYFDVVLFDLHRQSHRVFEQALDPASHGGEPRVGAAYAALAIAGADVVAANVSGIDTWRTSGGRTRPVFTCGCDANGVSISANGEIVTYGTGDGHALLFDVASQEELADKTISADAHVFTASAATPPRRAAAGRDPKGITVWDPGDGRTLAVVPLPRTADRVALSADGRTILAETGDRRWRVLLR